ncbi:MAG: hypothetical protein AAGB93_11560 [Planctomycetota bacterium]
MKHPLGKSLLVGIAACVIACGEHTHEVEDYVHKPGQPPHALQTELGPFRLRTAISGSNTTSRPASTVMTDSQGRLAGPYTLHVITSYYGETRDVCSVLEVSMQIGRRPPVVLHSINDGEVDVTFEPWLDHAVSGSHRIPLGDRLPFQEDDEVHFTVAFRPPGTDQVHRLRTSYVGRKRRTTTSKLETLVQG